jgi:hypothetical protein
MDTNKSANSYYHHFQSRLPPMKDVIKFVNDSYVSNIGPTVQTNYKILFKFH